MSVQNSTAPVSAPEINKPVQPSNKGLIFACALKVAAVAVVALGIAAAAAFGAVVIYPTLAILTPLALIGGGLLSLYFIGNAILTVQKRKRLATPEPQEASPLSNQLEQLKKERAQSTAQSFENMNKTAIDQYRRIVDMFKSSKTEFLQHLKIDDPAFATKALLLSNQLSSVQEYLKLSKTINTHEALVQSAVHVEFLKEANDLTEKMHAFMKSCEQDQLPEEYRMLESRLAQI